VVSRHALKDAELEALLRAPGRGMVVALAAQQVEFRPQCLSEAGHVVTLDRQAAAFLGTIECEGRDDGVADKGGDDVRVAVQDCGQRLCVEQPDGVSLAGFSAFLAAHDDRLFTVPAGQATGLDTLVSRHGQTLHLTNPPEQIVFLEG